MTDIQKMPVRSSPYKGVRNTKKLDMDVLDFAVSKVMPLKESLTREQFKLMVLYIVMEETKYKQ